RIGPSCRSLHRDFLLRAIGDHLGAAGELVAEPPVTPWRNDLQLGGKRRGGQFEADLVVALARRAMGQSIGLLLAGHFDHSLGDQWPRNAGTEKILTLIHRPRLD